MISFWFYFCVPNAKGDSMDLCNRKLSLTQLASYTNEVNYGFA